MGWKNYLPTGNYLSKVKNRNTRTRCRICLKLTIKTPERRQWRPSGVFIVNFEHIPHIVLVHLLLTLNMQMPAGLPQSVRNLSLVLEIPYSELLVFSRLLESLAL